METVAGGGTPSGHASNFLSEMTTGPHEKQHGNREHEIHAGSEQGGSPPSGHLGRRWSPLRSCSNGGNDLLLLRPDNAMNIAHHDDAEPPTDG